MSESDPAQFTVRAGRKIAEATRRVLGRGISLPPPDIARRYGSGFIEGELTEDLDEPTNPKTGATKAKAKRWRPIPGSTADPIDMELGDEEFDLVNRSMGLSATSGTHVIWVRIGTEWRIIWADC